MVKPGPIFPHTPFPVSTVPTTCAAAPPELLQNVWHVCKMGYLTSDQLFVTFGIITVTDLMNAWKEGHRCDSSADQVHQLITPCLALMWIMYVLWVHNYTIHHC